MRDYYSDLGVTPLASTADVRAAFKKLALQLHPDRIHEQPQSGIRPPPSLSVVGSTYNSNAGNVGHAPKVTFADVQEAYEVLSDNIKRIVYDAERQELLFPNNENELSLGASDVVLPSTDSLREQFAMYEEEAHIAFPATSHCSLDGRHMPTLASSFMAASTLLNPDGHRGCEEEQHAKWEELFEKRRGIIGRRPQSRLSNSGGPRRPPLPTEFAEHQRQSPAAVGGKQLPAQRPLYSRLELLRRARPSSGVALGPILTDMHLRHDQLQQPDALQYCDAPKELPHGSAPSANNKPSHASGCPSRPPLPSYHAGAPLRTVSSMSTPSSRASTPHEALPLPRFRPASSSTAIGQSIKEEDDRLPCGAGRQAVPQHEERRVLKGMSASRRESLGIGHGAAERPQSSSLDKARVKASNRTMKIFFA